jgi:hypothetical protein
VLETVTLKAGRTPPVMVPVAIVESPDVGRDETLTANRSTTFALASTGPTANQLAVLAGATRRAQ